MEVLRGTCNTLSNSRVVSLEDHEKNHANPLKIYFTEEYPVNYSLLIFSVSRTNTAQ